MASVTGSEHKTGDAEVVKESQVVEEKAVERYDKRDGDVQNEEITEGTDEEAEGNEEQPPDSPLSPAIIMADPMIEAILEKWNINQLSEILTAHTWLRGNSPSTDADWQTPTLEVLQELSDLMGNRIGLRKLTEDIEAKWRDRNKGRSNKSVGRQWPEKEIHLRTDLEEILRNYKGDKSLRPKNKRKAREHDADMNEVRPSSLNRKFFPSPMKRQHTHDPASPDANPSLRHQAKRLRTTTDQLEADEALARTLKESDYEADTESNISEEQTDQVTHPQTTSKDKNNKHQPLHNPSVLRKTPHTVLFSETSSPLPTPQKHHPVDSRLMNKNVRNPRNH